MLIDDRMRDLAAMPACDFFGVADLSSAQKTVTDRGGQWSRDIRTPVSVGIAMPGSIVDQLPNRSNRAVAVAYRITLTTS